MSSNPWETEQSFVNIGGLNHILSTNRRFCNDKGSHQEVIQDPSLTDHGSIHFINTLRELALLNKEQVKVSLDLKQRQLYHEFYNVLSTDVLDGLISMVDFLSNHLQSVIDNKNRIIEHLHQPFVGKPMAIDAKYHSDVCDFFPLIANGLAELSTLLNNFEWIHKYSVRNSNLSSSLQIINSSLTTLQNQYESVTEVRDLMNEMLKHKNDNDHT